MAVYGSLEGVKRFLQAVDGDDFGGDMSTRISETLAAISSIIEERTGVVWSSDDPDPESILVESQGASAELWLPKAVRSITSVVYAPEWSGSAWTLGTAIPSTTYWRSRDGRTLRTIYGYIWNGAYLVTGTWGDVDNEPPADIHYIANYVTAETFKKQNASPAGYAGPDGSVVLYRNALKEPDIEALLAKHARKRATSVVV
jgi:hypothetical protein